MKKITYVGPHESVEIASTGDLVARGESVEVPDDLAEALLAQETNWKPVARKADTKKTEEA